MIINGVFGASIVKPAQSPVLAKQKFTIIVDQFAMRKDISEKLIIKLSEMVEISSKIILCVPSHCILHDKLVERAQEFGHPLAVSIDYLNANNWKDLQKVIEQHAWIKGLVVWRIDPSLNLSETLAMISEWLNYRGIWMVYANITDFLSPENILTPDGFVQLSDGSERIKEQADYVLNQAKISDHGLLLVQPGVQHVIPLVDWLKENIHNIQLVGLK